jgi:hypothetical protein
VVIVLNRKDTKAQRKTQTKTVMPAPVGASRQTKEAGIRQLVAREMIIV